MSTPTFDDMVGFDVTDEHFQEALTSLEDAIKDVNKVWQLVRDGKIRPNDPDLKHALQLAAQGNGIPKQLVEHFEGTKRLWRDSWETRMQRHKEMEF